MHGRCEDRAGQGNLAEEPSWQAAVEAFNALLLDHVGHEGEEWHSFVISRKCCEIHPGSDMLDAGKAWTMAYSFLNRQYLKISHLEIRTLHFKFATTFHHNLQFT